MQEYLEIGIIVNTHGLKGEVKVTPLTDDPTRYEKLKSVYVDRAGSLESYNITGVKYLKSFVILKFKEIDDINVAEGLKGLYIKVDRKNAVKLPQNSYFICDLIDCTVFEENGNKLGSIKDVLKTGSNDIYVVRDENNKEILIPVLKSVVKEISIIDKKIIVLLPKGLVDDEI